MLSTRFFTLALLSALVTAAGHFVDVTSHDMVSSAPPGITIILPKTVTCTAMGPSALSFNVTTAVVVPHGEKVTLTKFDNGNTVQPVLIATNNSLLHENCGDKFSGYIEVDGVSSGFTEAGTSESTTDLPTTDDLNACWIPGALSIDDTLATHNASVTGECILFFAGFVILNQTTTGAAVFHAAAPSLATYGVLVTASALLALAL